MRAQIQKQGTSFCQPDLPEFAFFFSSETYVNFQKSVVIFFTTIYVSLQGNTVFAAGYGYLFHLSPEGPSKMPLLSFSENVAHSCTRYLGTFG